jgi:hypothetical protein
MATMVGVIARVMITRAVGWIEREAMSPVADRAQREPLSVREVLTRFVLFLSFATQEQGGVCAKDDADASGEQQNACYSRWCG